MKIHFYGIDLISKKTIVNPIIYLITETNMRYFRDSYKKCINILGYVYVRTVIVWTLVIDRRCNTYVI